MKRHIAKDPITKSLPVENGIQKPPDSPRSLPRVFIEGASMEDQEIDLPDEELVKLRKVLRLAAGAEIAVLPNDGSMLRCNFTGRVAEPIEQLWPDSESTVELTVAQSLPKGDKLDEIVRACTELGVARFLLFQSDRTIVQWDDKKVADRIRRLKAIAREACELSFRTRLPEIEWSMTLRQVLKDEPDAMVLSEKEGVSKYLSPNVEKACIVVGPEGGWSPVELDLISDRGITLGPRVLRVDHAAAAASAVLLINQVR